VKLAVDLIVMSRVREALPSRPCTSTYHDVFCDVQLSLATL
jgi:hypothetical protein